MAVFFLFIGCTALVLGSLSVAVLLICSVSWIGDRLGYDWLAPVLLLMAILAMCLTSLEHSLFVRMLAVFAVAGSGMLLCVEHGDYAGHGQERRSKSRH